MSVVWGAHSLQLKSRGPTVGSKFAAKTLRSSTRWTAFGSGSRSAQSWTVSPGRSRTTSAGRASKVVLARPRCS